MDTALTVKFPVVAHNLEGYIQAVNGYPLLSAEQERSLALRWQ